MASDLKETWNEAAGKFDDYGPPLRPSPEDMGILHAVVTEWHQGKRAGTVRVFLCGVTPEIVLMPWPFSIEMIGMDQAEEMVRTVWPGDLAGVRRGVVGNWLESGLAAGSQDIAIGDGGFGFLPYPDRQRALLSELKRLLAPGGLFVYRHFAQVEDREDVASVLSAARLGSIGSFHAFKWRLAMAMQADSASGVRQQDVWTAWKEARIDQSLLPQPGWSERSVRTIELYQGKQARLYFPTVREFTALLAEQYSEIKVEYPHYELGERCPTIAASPRR